VPTKTLLAKEDILAVRPVLEMEDKKTEALEQV